MHKLNYHDTFFKIAKAIAELSKDPHTKVGAVLVKDKHILSIGYNDSPKNFTYKFNWSTNEKYDYVIHAELNAIANACLNGINVKDADIYLTMSPCKDCIKLLIQYQIKNVYYLDEYKDIEQTKFIAKHSKIKLVKC